MKKKMSVEEYSKLTNSNKLEIEKLLFETVKEEMENLFSFLTVEKIEFNNYWEQVADEATRWKELSGFVLSNGKTYIRLPDINDYMMGKDRDVNYSKTLYDIQENVFEFFGLSNTVMGAVLAWGDEDYDF
jgi:hypothetical protein